MPAMKNIELIRRVLRSGNSEDLASALSGQDVAPEIEEISKFDDRQLLDFAGTSGPSQFKSIMIACRLAPRDVVVSFVVECALYVLPFARAAYPAESALIEFASIDSSNTSETRQKIAGLRESIKKLGRTSRADDDVRRTEMFNQMGYVPLEWGQDVGRAVGAVSMLIMTTIIVANQESSSFVWDVDATMVALVNVFPRSAEELGRWMSAKLSQLVEAYAAKSDV